MASNPNQPTTCFDANDGGRTGEGYNREDVLYTAVRFYMNQGCPTNQNCGVAQKYGWPINSWCVGSVTDMSYLFYDMDTFNEDINGWITSSVTEMNGMFYYASSFNGDLSNWDTSSVTDMSFMFFLATAFNGDVSNFDTSRVRNMRSMWVKQCMFIFHLIMC